MFTVYNELSNEERTFDTYYEAYDYACEEISGDPNCTWIHNHNTHISVNLTDIF